MTTTKYNSNLRSRLLKRPWGRADVLREKKAQEKKARIIQRFRETGRVR